MPMLLLFINHNGSEFNVVILAIPPSSPMLLTRNLLYTAITRAKRMLVVIGGKNIIDFIEIYALYGKHPIVSIPLIRAPFIPDILGVKVFCLCSPSFLKIIWFKISNKNGNILIPNKVKIKP